MVAPNVTKEFLEERIESNIDWIKYLSRDIGEMKKLREEFRDDADFELLISRIIWEEWNSIPDIKREIESDKKRIRELS